MFYVIWGHIEAIACAFAKKLLFSALLCFIIRERDRQRQEKWIGHVHRHDSLLGCDGRKGAKLGMRIASRVALCRGGVWKGENIEFWKLAASGEMEFALQTVIFYAPLTRAPVLEPHHLTVNAPRPHTSQCVKWRLQGEAKGPWSPIFRLAPRSPLIW